MTKPSKSNLLYLILYKCHSHPSSDNVILDPIQSCLETRQPQHLMNMELCKWQNTLKSSYHTSHQSKLPQLPKPLQYGETVYLPNVTPSLPKLHYISSGPKALFLPTCI
ncbi:unnamed protein product [Cuscuta campestris]|uniref:Uncharacterized protein n=1 Tax=Cuscuta campestris TaxID=132261 RepID=A0A484MDV7_9ASTE|nr:unnamed protein product [Cuscuta campestris]